MYNLVLCVVSLVTGVLYSEFMSACDFDKVRRYAEVCVHKELNDALYVM